MTKETIESAVLTLEIARTLLPNDLYSILLYITIDWVCGRYTRDQAVKVFRRLGDEEVDLLEEQFAEEGL